MLNATSYMWSISPSKKMTISKDKKPLDADNRTKVIKQRIGRQVEIKGKEVLYTKSTNIKAIF